MGCFCLHADHGPHSRAFTVESQRLGMVTCMLMGTLYDSSLPRILGATGLLFTIWNFLLLVGSGGLGGRGRVG